MLTNVSVSRLRFVVFVKCLLLDGEHLQAFGQSNAQAGTVLGRDVLHVLRILKGMNKVVDELVVSHPEFKPVASALTLQRNVEGVVTAMPEQVINFPVAAVMDFIEQFHVFEESGGMLFRVR